MDWRSVHNRLKNPTMSQAVLALPGDGSLEFLEGTSDKVEKFRYSLRILEC